MFFSSLMCSSVSLLVAVLASLTAVAGSSSNVRTQDIAIKTPAEKIIEAVPIADRTSFLLYQLALALNSSRNFLSHRPSSRSSLAGAVLSSKEAEKFKMIPTYKSFASDLLNWVMEDFTVSEDDVYDMLGSRDIILCTSSGLCFSGNNIGSFCCPF